MSAIQCRTSGGASSLYLSAPPYQRRNSWRTSGHAFWPGRPKRVGGELGCGGWPGRRAGVWPRLREPPPVLRCRQSAYAIRFADAGNLPAAAGRPPRSPCTGRNCLTVRRGERAGMQPTLRVRRFGRGAANRQRLNGCPCGRPAGGSPGGSRGIAELPSRLPGLPSQDRPEIARGPLATVGLPYAILHSGTGFPSVSKLWKIQYSKLTPMIR